ncbi:hypothetical protein D3C85_896310 [compost metagenome]
MGKREQLVDRRSIPIQYALDRLADELQILRPFGTPGKIVQRLTREFVQLVALRANDKRHFLTAH